MPPSFGTSGLRGLVAELTPDLVADYTGAFLDVCCSGQHLFVGYDLRPSSMGLAQLVAQVAVNNGKTVTFCGALPTPALAHAAAKVSSAAVMITGSHIPADRNGIKFYNPQGEITKSDEQAILAARSSRPAPSRVDVFEIEDAASLAYLQRYEEAFGKSLAGMHVGVYSHSAVGRDMLASALVSAGAIVEDLGRSSQFVPVDTEAVSGELRDMFRSWAKDHRVDAIVSTDGDSDRPLVCDEHGEVIPGDILGQITAQCLSARCVVTPISSNSGAELGGCFEKVIRTRIGSPFVIEAMEQVDSDVVGYEANGGFILGYEAKGPMGVLSKLMTRDAFLPIFSVLSECQGRPLSEIVALQPARFTAADRLQDVDLDRVKALLEHLSENRDARAQMLVSFDGVEAAIDLTDGVRMGMADGRIVHFRPSGNAPELRVYVESQSKESAQSMLGTAFALLRRMLES